MVNLAVSVAATLAGCGSAEESVALGTYQPDPAWTERMLRPATDRRGLAEQRGEVVVLEGDATLISGSPQSLGLSIDDTRNDPAAVVRRIAGEVADEDAILLLFTMFPDHGAGGPAYYLPIYNDTEGTGVGPIDQRAMFGAAHFTGLANLKRLQDHPAGTRGRVAAHELAHQHLAHLAASPTTTRAIDLLGRQRAHWHALLDTRGSLLGGADWRDTGAGRFVVIGREERFSELDLYGLGLLPAAEVPPFFFIADGRTEAGAVIPAEAQLPIGTVALGHAVELRIEDVIRALGPRPAGPPELRVVFALLTAPDQAKDAPEVEATRVLLETFRGELEESWRALTLGRGRLCTRVKGCPQPTDPDGGADAGVVDAAKADGGLADDPGGCTCRSAGRMTGGLDLWAVLLAALSGRARRQRCL